VKTEVVDCPIHPKRLAKRSEQLTTKRGKEKKKKREEKKPSGYLKRKNQRDKPNSKAPNTTENFRHNNEGKDSSMVTRN